VDREKAVLLGVPVQDVYSAIQAQFGSLMASQYNEYSRIWNVVLQSDSKFRQDPSDLTRLYTRSGSDRMIPLSAVVKTDYTMGPDLLPHFNGFRRPR
jgi:multidrug efflux pump